MSDGREAETDRWREELRLFFSTRAGEVSGDLTLADLCWVSGRDPRLWSDPVRYEELIGSIWEQTASTTTSRLLEVGTASGFLARGLAPRVGFYAGVDVSADAVGVARRLGRPNAGFLCGDGSRLPLRDNGFDAAFCYDVFTNFPDFAFGAGILREMLRVVRPGGRVLVGSLPDQHLRQPFEVKVQEVGQDLAARFGPPQSRASAVAAPAAPDALVPRIVCYYFERADFIALGQSMGVATAVMPVHPLNPYAPYRFSILYVKPGA